MKWVLFLYNPLKNSLAESGPNSDLETLDSESSIDIIYEQNAPTLHVNLTRIQRNEIFDAPYSENPEQFLGGFCYYTSEHDSIFKQIRKSAIANNSKFNFVSTLDFCRLYSLWIEKNKENFSECMHMLDKSFDCRKKDILMAFYTNSNMKEKKHLYCKKGLSVILYHYQLIWPLLESKL